MSVSKSVLHFGHFDLAVKRDWNQWSHRQGEGTSDGHKRLLTIKNHETWLKRKINFVCPGVYYTSSSAIPIKENICNWTISRLLLKEILVSWSSLQAS